jgi:putative Holliday junction resolvase
MGNILGVDYGSKRVGLAILDQSLGMAFPLSVLENKKTLVEDLCNICHKHSVKKVVLGESKNFNGQDNIIMTDVISLKKELESKGFDVVLHPEFMTSAQAERLQGKNDMLDASAATLILQSYIDQIKSQN